MCGIGSESIQKRLLEEEDLGLDKAMILALGMEAAQRNAEEVKGTKAKGAEIVAVQSIALAVNGVVTPVGIVEERITSHMVVDLRRPPVSNVGRGISMEEETYCNGVQK